MRRIEAKADRVDPEAVRAVIEAVRRGELVVLPTETVYGLAADPERAASIQRLVSLKGRAPGQRFTHHCASTTQALTLAPELPNHARRLAARYWPGPLTLVVTGREGTTVGLRVPAQAFTTAVLEAFGSGLFLTSVNRTGDPPQRTPDEIAAAFPEIDLLVDAGPPPLGEASAIVRCTRPQIEVLREGTLRQEDLLATAAVAVLVVCTGNTCRSPMAEALARGKLAGALGVPCDQLLARGILIRSAGIAAAPGAPASEYASAVVAELGLDLTGHLTTRVTQDLLDNADLVLGLTHQHVAAARRLASPTTRIELLDPTGEEVKDPFGGDLDTYRRARDAIGVALDRRLPGLLAMLG